MKQLPLIHINGPDDEWPWKMAVSIIRLFEALAGVLSLSLVNVFVSSRLVQWRMRKVAGRIAESLSEETMRDILRRIGGDQ